MSRARLLRAWRCERGQSLVEFALVTPLLLLLIVGLVEFARAWNTQQVLTDTAREALRSSVVANPGFTYAQMETLIDQALARAALDPDLADVTVEGWKAGDRDGGADPDRVPLRVRLLRRPRGARRGRPRARC